MKFCQKDVELYVGKMKSRDILQLYEIDKFKDEELEGYQREQYEDRTSELIEYLEKCPVAVMPSLFVSVRDAHYFPGKEDFGRLEIPRRKGSIWIIDGQHRIGGFEKAHRKFTFAKNPSDGNPEIFSILMDYELPIVFIDTHKAAETLNRSSNNQNQDVTPQDLERVIFFVVNKTQKGIHPSLKDALLYRIKAGGIEGIPAIIRAAYVGIALNKEIDSPLVGTINIGGKGGAGKPIQLNSFVSSLELLFKCEEFAKLGDDERLKFVKTYWATIKRMFPEAFNPATWKNYMLLKAIGVYCLNALAYDIYKIFANYRYNLDNDEILKKIVGPMSTFDWSRDKSPLSSLGGMKGARSGYEKLRECLSPASDESKLENAL
jgi:DGQHR domain-containing protein